MSDLSNNNLDDNITTITIDDEFDRKKDILMLVNLMMLH